MELSAESRLYNDAVAATRYADERLEQSTRADYTSSLRRFVEFCTREGYPNPLEHRFVELPSVLAAFINQLATSNKSQWPAEKLRSALAWHYSKPEMLKGGHPHDRWIVLLDDNGTSCARGNPARSAMIAQILVGLNKSKKRERTPTRASPMSLAKLTKLLDFLSTDSLFNESMRLWLSAVCSMCFYGMCRINEVLLMKKGDIQVGMTRPDDDGVKMIRFGCFTIRDRKTDHDPHSSRTYNLHSLPPDERAAEALTHVTRWFVHAESRHRHTWRMDEYAFPSLTKVPRGAIKKQRLDCELPLQGTFDKVGIRWGTPMADNNFTQVLNIAAAASGINQSVHGDSVWFTSHCFRRGGAQYRFMFAPDDRRWSLKMVKWWAGWSPNEQSETVVRYLIDDVLDHEESQLGDMLAPDKIHRSKSLLGEGGETEQGPVTKKELFAEIKLTIQESIRGITARLPPAVPSAAGTTSSDAVTTTPLLSELPDAKSWRDYIHQYWHNDPPRHQYRAGVEMLSHERKHHRSRLSRMKILAEFVRHEFQDDVDQFETAFTLALGSELTVNKILAEIRRRKSVATPVPTIGAEQLV